MPHDMIHYTFRHDNFEEMYDNMILNLLEEGDHVNTGHWQAIRGVPQTETVELGYVRQNIECQPTVGSLASMVKPNLPWADNHFAERVSGIPFNPPPSHEEWPYAQKGNTEHIKDKQFSHTYPERLWPKQAGEAQTKPELTYGDHRGIRFPYGDLNDVRDSLLANPYTRQAYAPLWFPEDTWAAAHGERVPCTLGYHFMVRRNDLGDDEMNLFYPIRSCDVLRHWRDDVYMAGRLLLWMIRQCENHVVRSADINDGESPWDYVKPGRIIMFIPSLHIFQGDVPNLERKYLAKNK